MGVGKGCGGGKGSMKMVQKRDKMGYKSKVSCNTFEKKNISFILGGPARTDAG